MVCRSSLVALLLAAGCFSEPNFESSGTHDGTSSQGTTTSEIEVSGTSPDPSSTGPTGPSGSSSAEGTSECLDGRVGCPCADGSCEADALCVEGFCELPIPGDCGDREVVPPENCDDGNNEPGDGCSPTCTLERECFLAHLGGPGESSIVRAYSVFPDGTMEEFAEHEVPEHNPPESGAGSELSRAAVSCAGQVYVASSAAGVITGLRPTLDGLTETGEASVPGVRELACDPGLGLLFAVSFIPNGFALETFDVSAGTLVEDAYDEYVPQSIVEMRAVRLTLDRGAGRAILNFVGDGGAGTPPSFIDASYGPGQLTLGSPSLLSVLRDDLGALLHVAPTGHLVGVGGGTTDGRVVYRLVLGEAGPGNTQPLFGAPWDERRNIWPFRLPGGEIGLAMGGTQGVVIAAYAKVESVTSLGETIGTQLSNTFARTAFDDTVLIVASPEGYATYDLTQPKAKNEWPMLSALPESTAQTFTSGAVVACP